MKRTLLILLLFLGSCNLLADGSVDNNAADAGLGVGTIKASCTDSQKNGIETDLNCGGDCRPCTDYLSCLRDSDCASGICSKEICSPARCDDGIKNGAESDLDCGGDCDPCGAGLNCVVLRDCVGELCEDSKCLDPVCHLRCGGGCPDRCQRGDDCEKDSDCEEAFVCDGVVDGVCTSDCTCVSPSVGWLRTISFTASAASTGFYAYIRVPELVEGDIGNIVFEQGGQRLASETAEESGAYWVYIENVVFGENEFQLKMQDGATPSAGMWSDHVALFHSPGLLQIIASEMTVIKVVNIESTPGVFGNAGFFDGSTSYILAEGRGSEALFPSFTISAWFKPEIQITDWQPVVGKQFSTTNSDDFAMGIINGRVYGCTVGICAKRAVSVGDWTFAVMTYSEGSVKMYIDGELAEERSGIREQSLARNPVTIGGDIDNSAGVVDKFFLGSIDEIRFSSVVHTSAAIRLQYLSADVSFFVFGEKQNLLD